MVKLNKIYTKTGDDGTTGLADGSRRKKNDLRVVAYGNVDEANSFVGLLIDALQDKNANKKIVMALTAAQHDLFDLGADLAKPFANNDAQDLRILAKQVNFLETTIDEWNKDLPPLESFILPGGGYVASLCHVARTIVRRAERAAVALQGVEAVNPLAVQYLNRLSDLLFVLARVLARDKTLGGQGEVLWKPGKNR